LQKKLLRYSLYAFIALAAFGAGVWVNQARLVVPEASPSAVTPATKLYAITLPDLQGRPQRVEQWRGKVLVINFWATWCAPCREEIPVFVEMQQKYGAQGLQFVGISIDQADKTSDFSANFKINYPTLIGTFDSVEVSRQAGNIRRALPFTVVLNRQGEVVTTELGGLTQQRLETIIKPLI